ncbi:hypothetical protein A2276_04995 [candidate division WOR-1 bacterium RIFOXYA12_FULL_43_27]|uniref:Uncharacterized protein n=1 Tax=candidate division WOR-1 bacterium RIFOXYC2_FULL_46_14 TaxID=1802587 RepID=A0A1F4U873_UNCSA|nr:MAG: hypothetical protein A2276_04995 [candidate division WOR-1 bacterium RIFOXYA12_FULL_43_27]OGC20023.1 MAG: hypothetical protein A2292_03000 [candidate division WOR-1 bacterium RIFOXYB2_FULL_46_45]OGC32240.1 MAG: hypothetical protein A2232_08445 [candidate division WOR-1 bacterium RIFOXYA2_FULL_46_56]OGC41144.1 MAG: hypothetical protein A2438_07385 [candidate division WOR-1 bacterium RIFOXYC2_FULL_46_14]
MSDWQCNFKPTAQKYYTLKPEDKLCVNTDPNKHYRIEVKSRDDAELKLRELAKKALTEESWIYIEVKLKNGKIARFLCEDGVNEEKGAIGEVNIKVLDEILKLGQILEIGDYHIHPTDSLKSVSSLGLPVFDLTSPADLESANTRKEYLARQGFKDIPYDSRSVSEKKVIIVIPPKEEAGEFPFSFISSIPKIIYRKF